MPDTKGSQDVQRKRSEEDMFSDPAWMRKAVKYFCDNYMIDGESFDATQALKIQGDAVATAGPHSFKDTPQGYDFWDCFLYLKRGWLPKNQIVKCKPWSLAEKRRIDALPDPRKKGKK